MYLGYLFTRQQARQAHNSKPPQSQFPYYTKVFTNGKPCLNIYMKA